MIQFIAKLTRRFHPKGTERLLRLICRKSVKTTIPYDGDLKINIDTSQMLDWQIFFEGHYETAIVKLIKTVFPKGGTFVDVGANIGCLSIIAAKTAGRVIAIEPVEYVANKIKLNCELNGLTNVSILPMAVSDKDGVVPFYVLRGSEGCGSFYPRHFIERGFSENTEEIQVNVRTLDEVLKGEEKVDFIKIDTEGHDGNVIMGALEIIKKFHPIIVFERGRLDLAPIKDVLNELGYVLEDLDRSNILCK